MSSTALAKKASPGSILIKTLIGKFDAVRYLPKLAFGFLQFDSAGNLAATNDLTVTGVVKLAPSATATNLTTAGAGTYTAAALDSGVITRDPNGGARTDTTDTAANLISTLGLTANYQQRECLIVNTADAAETITLAGGTGVTLKGTITIEQNTAIRLAILRTGSAAVTVRQI